MKTRPTRSEIIELCQPHGGQQGAARFLGVDPSTVRRWIAGTATMPAWAWIALSEYCTEHKDMV